MTASRLFAHGVASGDPHAEGAVIWTRVSTSSSATVPVRWRVSSTPDLVEAVAEGEVVAAAAHDFTVKVDVPGLLPATTYYYGFEVTGVKSPVGRTRTVPAGPAHTVRLGVVSCACWSHGFFNAYRHLAERDVDLVVHLGDYIYENGDSWDEVGRSHEPPSKLVTLGHYRTRHAQYKSDPDLQHLHQRHPVVAVWDDHDVAGDAWRDGAGAHDPDEDGDWHQRRAAAVQAYLEWLPVRLRDPSHPDRIYRTVQLGDLAQLIMLDTRLVGRDQPPGDGQRPVTTVQDRDRSLLGREQWAWLRGELMSSRSPRWRLIGNQVMVAPLRVIDLPKWLRRLIPGLVAGGAGVNGGQWDGYPNERRVLFELLADQAPGQVVVLTGDLHSSWAAELTLDPRGTDPPVGVEFVTPSVTSRSFADQLAPPVPGGRAALRRLIAHHNRHMRFVDLEGHGYMVVDVNQHRVQAEWWHVDTVSERALGERLVARWVIEHGEPRLTAVG